MRSSELDLAQGGVAQDRGRLACIEISRQVSPMRTIIAATDFSKASNQAVLKGAAIAARTGAWLHIFHAARFRIEPDQAEHFAALAEGYIDTLRARVQCRFGPALEVSGTDSTAWQDIYPVLERQKADLLVVGQHVHPNGLDMFNGTFVERLATDCPVPVLVSVSDPETPYRRILATVDLGPASERAMPVLRAIAPDSKIDLMQIERARSSVSHPCDEPHGLGVAPTYSAHAAARFRDRAGFGTETELFVVEGDPRLRIRQEVSARSIDLVALTGAEPMRGLKDDFLRTPPCDLMVFPAGARQSA
ncbi:universal stress protein [Limimaricola variabilis]|uniref:universal stress protein n=1 Tax=Limimaricola variabilis TaxID=1492771 RepID=UPI002AC899F6|nr:universal stress protein [Limimaricola variabilis]WPY94423.1 universal stress protein [Limimaricola variabilis]